MPSNDRRFSDSARSRSDRRPPDYRSRAGRWQLFMLVAALMSVLVAMNEVRKPGMWAWMWRSQNGTTPSLRVDTRLHPDTGRPSAVDGTEAASTEQPKPASKVENASLNAWRQIWNSLEQREKSQLSRLMRTARNGQTVGEAQASQVKELTSILERQWNQLLEKQNHEVFVPEQELPSQARQTAIESLASLEVSWHTKWKPAFDAAAAGRSWTADERSTLIELEKTLDVLALADVSDDTVWRAADIVAWFRLVEQLQKSDAAELSDRSVGKVGFLQIFQQAAEYRGKLVTIRGTARLAYRVPAPMNDLGIKEYSLFWVQPEDGSNRPIVVYSLAAPDGFPTISSEHRKVQEDVEVTGFLFKRWVYRAADGLNSVPLLVAKAPVWFPRPAPPKSDTEQLSEQLGDYFWPVMIGGAICLAGAGCIVVWLVNRSTRLSPGLQKLRAQAELEAAEPEHWKNLPATSSVEESLRHMENTEE